MGEIAMLGPSLAGKGGIASVVSMYRRSGLLDRCHVIYIETQGDGSRVRKTLILSQAIGNYLWRQLRGKIALLHVHTASGGSFWRKSCFVFLAGLAGIPVILHIHGGRFGEFYFRRCGKLRKLLVRTIIKRASTVVTVSQALKRVIESIGYSGRLLVIPNPVDVKLGAGLCGPIQRAPCLLFFLGRIGAEKGAWDLLEAARRLRRNFVGLEVKFGGDGNVRDLMGRAAALGIGDAVEAIGWVDGEEKLRRLAECTVFVLPSYAEGLPMAVLEAMAAGAPVVTTKVGGIPDVIKNGLDGLLIEPGDVEGLARAVESLLTDPRMRDRLSAAGKRKVLECFTLERITPLVEKLYGELAGTCITRC